MNLTGKNIIGNSLSAEGQVLFEAVNPANGNKLDIQFSEATPGEIDGAVQRAARAFGEYRHKSGKEKAEFLETIGDEIMAIGDSLIQRCMEETGLPEGRLTGERGRTVNQLTLFAALLKEGSWVDARIETAAPQRKPAPKPDIRSMKRALGPVGIFGASNFPLAFSVAGGDTASALAAGCPVVVKAHPAHPGTSEMVGSAIANAIKKCGMPEGTFSLVHGQSTQVGLALVRHPLIKAIGFTGSFRGGKALFDEAAKREEPIPVYAEMGSTNPVFILPGALQEKNETIAQNMAASVSLGVGQFCTNPGLIFMEESAESATFRNQIAEKIKNTGAGTMLTSGISASYKENIEKLAKAKGVDLLAKGGESGNGCAGTAYLLHAGAGAFLGDRSLEEEVFGPSTLIITADNKNQLLEAAQKLGGHLTATIHGTEKDLEEYAELINILEQKAGRLIFNGYPTGVEVCHAMVHGGPFPATTDSKTTSVGTLAIDRFVRPVCYQDFPLSVLPAELQDDNPLKIWRLVNGELKR